ncbi:chaperonin 10-like protein [Pyrenochaeta sp. MPI-SDFR-AT-0127]|nr:chaperonin 10-like protein [Pyrenochaeta sp. MPI-SDFR-AT-0127]
MGSINANTMLAAQYNKASFELCTIPIPTAKDNEILIKTKCASLCHSDLMLFWDHTSEKPESENVTIGHENTGYVVAMGKDVNGFKIGDRVGCLGCSYACYDCEGCQVHNLFCDKGTQRLHGFQCDGHFAEYSVADYRNAMVLPEGMDMVSSAPLFCAGITAYHVVKGCSLQEGQWLAVVGCGGLGHLAVQYAKAMGLKVIGIDISDSQLQAVQALGADYVINTMVQPGWELKIKEITNGGCHATAVFSAANAAYDTALKIIRINGLLMVAGIPTKPLSINALDILLGKYRIAGRSSGVPQNMPEAIHFSQDHDIKSHITTFNSIHDIHEVINLARSGKSSGRIGIVFD